MLNLKDIWARNVRLTDERLEHLETGHPEMRGQLEKIQKALSDPEKVVRSITDEKVELFVITHGIDELHGILRANYDNPV